MSNWRQTLRTKVVPLAFLAGMVFLTARTCHSEFAQVTITLDFGAHAADIRSFRVDVFREGESVSAAYLEREVGPDKPLGRPSFEAQLDAGAYQLYFEVHLRDGTRRRFERTIETTDNAAITVSLARNFE